MDSLAGQNLIKSDKSTTAADAALADKVQFKLIVCFA